MAVNHSTLISPYQTTYIVASACYFTCGEAIADIAIIYPHQTPYEVAATHFTSCITVNNAAATVPHQPANGIIARHIPRGVAVDNRTRKVASHKPADVIAITRYRPRSFAVADGAVIVATQQSAHKITTYCVSSLHPHIFYCAANFTEQAHIFISG